MHIRPGTIRRTGPLTIDATLLRRYEVAALRVGLMITVAILSGALGVVYAGAVRSQTTKLPVAVTHHVHHILFHVASDDVTAMSHAISGADNAMKFYQARGEAIVVEIVANGAGVRMMRADTSPIAPSIAYLHKTYPAIVLSACGTTLRLMKERDGIEPPLLDGVRVTPAGIARIIELEEAGWSYVRS